MSIMTVGSLQIFIKNVTLRGVLQVRVHVFRKTMVFISSVYTIYFSLKDRYVRRSYAWNIEYNPSSFFRTHISFDFHRFP